jgi:glycosyltransferase involved in cell wall biosynthesis
VRIVNYHPRALVGDGGITNSVRRLSEAFARLGSDPVIVYDGRGEAHHDAGVEWLPIRHVARGPFRVPLRIGAALASADVVVVNSGWTSANVVAGRAARGTHVPYVLAPRGAYDRLIMARNRLAKRVWWVLAEQRLIRGAAAVHTFFDEQRGDVEWLGDVRAVVVAPNGVSVPTDLRWDGGSGGYLAYVGRFDPEHKGLDLLLAAVAMLPPNVRPELRLHGPDWRGGKARVRRLVADLELDGNVLIGDAVYGAAKWELLARARGFVYPSRWEGFGNSLAEAAALGVPTLATGYPLARYLEDRGACIVTDANPEAIAGGLRRLQRHEVVEAHPRPTAMDEFQWDSIARRWLDQLERLCEPAGRLRD